MNARCFRLNPRAMTAQRRGLQILCAGALAGVVWSGAAVAGKAHVHGVVQVNVAIDGPQLRIDLDAPLDNLLGFERAPRTPAERQAAAELLTSLRQPATGARLFAPPPGAACVPTEAEVSAPALEPAAARPGAGQPQDPAHADLAASYSFRCQQPAALSGLQTGLFDAYRRIQRIEVLVAGPQGQVRQVLKRPQQQIRLAR